MSDEPRGVEWGRILGFAAAWIAFGALVSGAVTGAAAGAAMGLSHEPYYWSTVLHCALIGAFLGFVPGSFPFIRKMEETRQGRIVLRIILALLIQLICMAWWFTK